MFPFSTRRIFAGTRLTTIWSPFDQNELETRATEPKRDGHARAERAHTFLPSVQESRPESNDTGLSYRPLCVRKREMKENVSVFEDVASSFRSSRPQYPRALHICREKGAVHERE